MLADWTDGEIRPWAPAARRPFETPLEGLPLEYGALGSRQTSGADLIVDHGDGLVGARLIWSRDQVVLDRSGPVTRLVASGTDTTGNLVLTLNIETTHAHDVVSKWVEVRNVGEDRLTLPRVFGPAWELPLTPAVAIDYLAGAWCREFTPCHVDLPAGELSIGSRQGITSHTFAPVLRVSSSTAANSPTYGLALAWSGSWRMLVEVSPFRDRIRVAGGVDDESGVVTLEAGDSFTTPTVLGVLAPDGASGVRRRWHDYQRGELARSTGPEHRPVVYNSWYATGFDVRLEHQLALAEVACDLGVEAFVVDDGWFAGRHDESHGLGNWWPDPEIFPAGLGPLIDGVVDRGMRFGIWVEPEAVSPGSEVMARHPDWIYRAGDRPVVTVRHQHVLDLGRPEVVAWIGGWLRELLADSRISYLKWDMNRPVSDGGRPGDHRGRQWSIQHTEGYYAILAMLRAEFPHVTVEACSGGGGRIDHAVLGLTDVVWPSDETGPRDRAAIQHGFLSAYGPHVMSSWVTDEPDRVDVEPVSVEFRFVVAMAGVLGIGADLLAWDRPSLDRAGELIRLYQSIRHTIHLGVVEQHGHPRDLVHAIEYGGPEQTILLVYGRPGRPDTVRFRPRTLTPGRRYRRAGDGREFTGSEGAVADVEVPFSLAPDADVVVLDLIEAS